MQTSSYVDKDKWDDLASKTQVINIRTKGTYKPIPKPVCPPVNCKPCCDLDEPVCPIDHQPLPVPCELCPINKINPDNNGNHQCNNCQHNSSTYGTPGITEIEIPEKETINVDIKPKTVKKTAVKKTTKRITKKATNKKTKE